METIVMADGVDAPWQYVDCGLSAEELAAAVAAGQAGVFAPTTAVADDSDPLGGAAEMDTAEMTGGEDGDGERRGVLREELRVNILQRRLQKGLGAVQLDWRFGKNEKLTPEEEEKRRMRRERNRVAASRCRERRREKTYILVTETDKLESSNKELMTEIQELETERQELMSILTAHQQTCSSCSPTVALATAPDLDQLHIDP